MGDAEPPDKLSAILAGLEESVTSFKANVDQIKPYVEAQELQDVLFDMLTGQAKSYDEILKQLTSSQCKLAAELPKVQKSNQAAMDEAAKLRDMQAHLKKSEDETQARSSELEHERELVVKERQILETETANVKESQRLLDQELATTSRLQGELISQKAQCEARFEDLHDATSKIQSLDSVHLKLFAAQHVSAMRYARCEADLEATAAKSASDQKIYGLREKLRTISETVPVGHLSQIQKLNGDVQAAQDASIKRLEALNQAQTSHSAEAARLNRDVERLELEVEKQKADNKRLDAFNGRLMTLGDKFKIDCEERFAKKYNADVQKRVQELEQAFEQKFTGFQTKHNTSINRLEAVTDRVHGHQLENVLSGLHHAAELLGTEANKYDDRVAACEVAKTSYVAKAFETSQLQQELAAAKVQMRDKLAAWRLQDEQKNLALQRREAVVQVREQEAWSVSPEIRGIKADFSSLVASLKRRPEDELLPTIETARKRVCLDKGTSTAEDGANIYIEPAEARVVTNTVPSPVLGPVQRQVSEVQETPSITRRLHFLSQDYDEPFSSTPSQVRFEDSRSISVEMDGTLADQTPAQAPRRLSSDENEPRVNEFAEAPAGNEPGTAIADQASESWPTTDDVASHSMQDPDQEDDQPRAIDVIDQALQLFILPSNWGQFQRDLFGATLRERFGHHTSIDSLSTALNGLSKGSKRTSNSSDRICLFAHGDRTRGGLLPKEHPLVRNHCPMHRDKDSPGLCLIIKLANDNINSWIVSERQWDEAEAARMRSELSVPHSTRLRG